MKTCTFLILLLCVVNSVYASNNRVVEVIKSDSKISDLDKQLNTYYELLMKTQSQSRKSAIKMQQRAWLKDRDRIYLKNLSTDVLNEFYTKRVNNLWQDYMKSVDIILKGLITYEERIDSKQKLLLLQNCELDFCIAYKLYFEYDKDDLKDAEKVKLDQTLNELVSRLTEKAGYSFIHTEDDGHLQAGITKELETLLAILGSYELYRDLERYMYEDRLPLWLVLKHPNIINFIGDRFSPRILFQRSVHELPGFKKLDDTLDSMEAGHWSTTSYGGGVGSIIKDIYQRNYNFINLISFAPFLDKLNFSADKKLLPLYVWSFEGIWNRKEFLKFKSAFDNAVAELKKYYQENYNLAKYVSIAENVLASYVYHRHSSMPPHEDNKAYQLFSQPNLSLNDIKSKAVNFTQEDKNLALAVAILNGYTKPVIEWIISNGADVNSFSMFETPLMKAISRPEIVKFLLERGANPNIATVYGKTPLFYAVQFNDLESAKLLVASGADVNAKIKNLEELKEIHVKYGNFLLESVARHTPLIYAIQNSSKEIIDFIIQSGGNYGDFKEDDFKR